MSERPSLQDELRVLAAAVDRFKAELSKAIKPILDAVSWLYDKHPVLYCGAWLVLFFVWLGFVHWAVYG